MYNYYCSIDLKLGRHLGIYDAEMHAKFQHNRAILNTDHAQMRLGCDIKLVAIILLLQK